MSGLKLQSGRIRIRIKNKDVLTLRLHTRSSFDSQYVPAVYYYYHYFDFRTTPSVSETAKPASFSKYQGWNYDARMGLPAFQYCLWNKSWRLKGSPCSRTGHRRLCLVSSSSEHTPCTRAGWSESRRLQGLRQVCSEGGACREARDDQITRVTAWIQMCSAF